MSEATRPRVLVVSDDAIGPAMAGPAIRSWELCRALHSFCQPTLVVPDGSQIPLSAPFPIVTFRDARWRRLLREHAAVISQGHSIRLRDFLFSPAKQIVDLYDPLPLELLQHGRGRSGAYQREKLQDRLETLLRFGDHFLCACSEQRDFWLGALSACGRIQPSWQERDPTFQELIAVVPFGIPGEEPPEVEGVLQKYFPGLPASARVLWWGGGLWDWLDPITLIRAVFRLRRKHPDYHLVFPGVQHPNPGVPPHQMVERARELARSLDLEGRGVWFGAGWLPYQERGACLRQSAAGVSLHRATLEARFSFRTRLLDYLWAGIPIIAAGGDPLGERARKEGWGLIVEPGDEEGLVLALTRFAEDEGLREGLRRRAREEREAFRWELAVMPLAHLLQDRRRAPDRATGGRRLYWLLRQGVRLLSRGLWYGRWPGLYRRLRAHIRFIGSRTRPTGDHFRTGTTTQNPSPRSGG